MAENIPSVKTCEERVEVFRWYQARLRQTIAMVRAVKKLRDNMLRDGKDSASISTLINLRLAETERLMKEVIDEARTIDWRFAVVVQPAPDIGFASVEVKDDHDASDTAKLTAEGGTGFTLGVGTPYSGLVAGDLVEVSKCSLGSTNYEGVFEVQALQSSGLSITLKPEMGEVGSSSTHSGESVRVTLRARVFA